MIVPGTAWLEFRIEPDAAGGSLLTQRALFAPLGLFGRLYWLAMAPFHPLIFKSMAVSLTRSAEELERQGRTAAVATSSDAPTGPPEDLVAPAGEPGHEPPPSRKAG
jgi:hypothetical protein